jgi:hypothetical protein
VIEEDLSIYWNGRYSKDNDKARSHDTLMKNHSWLEVRCSPNGIYEGCKSAEWEFRSITTPYRTRTSFTALAHAEQLMAALP